jgi:predicted RNA-binding Zn-ribbon protein involved in translation (DUF1610 family)
MLRRCFFRDFLSLASAAICAMVGAGSASAASAVYHRSHNCPRCGRAVYRVHSFRFDGRHYHKCGATLWYH